MFSIESRGHKQLDDLEWPLKFISDSGIIRDPDFRPEGSTFK